jgi:hypothetical protein
MDDNNGYRGLRFLELLTVVFIALKLLGAIKWSWIWVLSPLWAPLVLIVIVLIVMWIIHKAAGIDYDDDWFGGWR